MSNLLAFLSIDADGTEEAFHIIARVDVVLALVNNLPVRFSLGVKEKPLITFLCTRPCLDIGYQRRRKGYPTLGAPPIAGGGTPVGAQAYAIFVGFKGEQVGAIAIAYGLPCTDIRVGRRNLPTAPTEAATRRRFQRMMRMT